LGVLLDLDTRSWLRGAGHAWPFLVAGVLTKAVVISVFAWLALYSDKRGYDARVGHDGA